jgi:hypothetical protein
VNCQEANLLFDADPQRLSPTQREAIQRHADTCAACGAELADWEALLMSPVPATPASLWPRIMAALPVPRAPRGAVRPLVIGGVLLAGLALAGTWAEWGRRDAVPDSTATLAVPVAAAPADVDGADGSVKGTVPEQTALPGAVDGISTPAIALDPHRVLVLKRPEVAADSRALALAEQCHDLIVRELRSFRGLSLVVDAGAPEKAATRLVGIPERDLGIARGQGAGKVVTISTASGCQAMLYDAATGEMISGASASGLEEGRVPVDVFSRAMARDFGDKILLDADSELAQARAGVLDTSLGDHERVQALQVQLRKPRSSAQDAAFFDAQVIAAAIQLGTKSADPGVRTSVWSTMRNVRDPSLVKPLLQVLAKDTDAQVRYQAALDLNAFLDQPGVREALRRAAAEDPSSEPEAMCCALTVREAAQRSLIADNDFRKWVFDTLRDERLPVRSRLIALQGSSPDGRFWMLSILDLGDEAARIVFDIGQRQRDAGLRRMAWTALNHARPDDAFAPVLVEDMASHEDEYVRAAAATALAGYADRPAVRAAFERAMNDPSMAVRRAAGNALATSGK